MGLVLWGIGFDLLYLCLRFILIYFNLSHILLRWWEPSNLGFTYLYLKHKKN